MKPTDWLKEEHREIEQMLQVLDKVCEKLESGEKVNPEHLEQSIDFIKGFADGCHHAKEEDLLFPEMEEVGVPNEGGPIGVMLHEHVVGRNYVKNMSAAVVKYKTGDQDFTSEFIENAKGYITLLTDHIQKEDNILFEMADAHLSIEKQKELENRFEIVQREKIGVEKVEGYHKILSHLKSIYL